jgi:hypothetical protein
MTRIASFLLGTGLALASIGMAQADTGVAGPWKMTVGANGAGCSVTLSPDDVGTAGTVTAGDNCPGGLNSVANWRIANNGVQLIAGTGDLVAWLRPQGDGYVGTRFADGRKIALSR